MVWREKGESEWLVYGVWSLYYKKMGENNETREEQRLLIERIEVASEIVRSSHTAVAFQRAFFLEVLTIDRVINEMDEFIEKVNRLQAKLTVLFNDLQHAENESGAGRAASISEKLETLKTSFDDFKERSTQAKDRREEKSKELNVMVLLPDLNIMKIDTMSVKDLRGFRTPNYTPFVNDSDFHLAEEISEEWGKLRRKLENYFQKYVEDTISVRVEIFGSAYSNDIHNNNNNHTTDDSKSLIHRLSNLISSSRKNSTSSNNSVVITPTQQQQQNNNGKSSKAHYVRSESFFYCENPTSMEEIGTCAKS